MYNISTVNKTRDTLAVEAVKKEVGKYMSEGKSEGRLYPSTVLDNFNSDRPTLNIAVEQWGVENGILFTVAYDCDEMTIVDFSLSNYGGGVDKRKTALWGLLKWNRK